MTKDNLKWVTVTLALVAMVGVSLAYTATLTYRPMTFPGNYDDENYNQTVTMNMDNSVQGSGYFMTYRYAEMGNLAIKDYVHGSGTIDNEMILFAQENLLQSKNASADWSIESLNCINLKEDNVMVYAPMKLAIGRGYYVENPINFDSLLKEKTWLKNYRAASSIHHEVEYAHGIDKELEYLAKERTFVLWDPTYEGNSYTGFKVNEHIDDGKVHFGVLQSNATSMISTYGSDWPSTFRWNNAWTDPKIEFDEDYFGTYDIAKNITIETPYRLVQKNVDWLPCCDDTFGNAYYKGWIPNPRDIFSCKCKGIGLPT